MRDMHVQPRATFDPLSLSLSLSPVLLTPSRVPASHDRRGTPFRNRHSPGGDSAELHRASETERRSHEEDGAAAASGPPKQHLKESPRRVEVVREGVVTGVRVEGGEGGEGKGKEARTTLGARVGDGGERGDAITGRQSHLLQRQR